MPRAPNPSSCAEVTRGPWRFPFLSRGNVIVAARWLVTLLAFWVVLHSIDLDAVVGAIGRSRRLAVGLAGLVVLVQFVLLVLRWQVVIGIVSGKSSGLRLLALLLGQSFLIGQVLPSSIGGDVARSVLLARLTGAATAVRSVVCDRMLGFASLAVIAFPALGVIAIEIGNWGSVLIPAIVALGTLISVIVFALSPRSLHVSWLGRYLATAASDVRISLASGGAVALGLGCNLLSVLLIYILGMAVGAGLRALDCLILVPPALLLSALPISLGGWGVREGALVTMFNLVHADPAGVAAASVMFGLSAPLIGGIVAAVSFFAGWDHHLPKGADHDG